MMKWCIFCVILLLSGGQAQSRDYLDSVPVFWKTLYPLGGESLYCGARFAPYDRRYNIEHVFPMSWVARSLKCGSRRQCRASSALFNRIESDMHNLYPARADLNEARGSMGYGILEGEQHVEPGCDLEIDMRKRHVEPRPGVRGNIARSMLYMAVTYPELQLFQRQRELLERWHREDPVDQAERKRSRRIAKIQGNSNPLID